MASVFPKFDLEALEVEVVPGSCAAEVGGPPCAVIGVVVVIALILNPDLIP